MNDLLSSISGQLGRALLFGTLLPVLLFVAVGVVLVSPLIPSDAPLIDALLRLEKGEIAFLSFLSVALAGLLYSFNAAILRLYQGYPWKDTWFGRRRVQRYREELAAAQRRRPVLRRLRRLLEKKGADDERIGTLTDWQRDLSLRINLEFPRHASVLPTRLGNVLRNADNYPRRQYGISGATLYSRLLSQIDSRYLAGIDDAKRAFDFMLNSSLLSVLTAIALLGAGFAYGLPLATPASLVGWLIEIGLFVKLAQLLYERSVSRAIAWGATIKGAFDLYRWDLLKQLGYRDVPESLEDERKLWRMISGQIIHGDPPAGVDTGRLGRYTAPRRPRTSATSAQGYAGLKISRGVGPGSEAETQEIILEIRNTKAEAVDEVIVTDTLPQKLDYVWGSAHLRSGCPQSWKHLGKKMLLAIADGIKEPQLRVDGTNPYSFYLGSIDAGGSVTISYRALAQPDTSE